MSAREEILGRVRAALEGADRREVTVPRGYRSAATPATSAPPTATLARSSTAPSTAPPTAPPGDVVDLFCERVADYRALVSRCGRDEVPTRIAEALGSAARVVVPEGLEWEVTDSMVDNGLSASELDTVDAVVTGATVGIAATGTIVLTHGPGEGRRAVSLVPDLHVCVVRTGQIVTDVPSAFPLLDPSRPTTWISGPSATSDIELNRVEGVHGPRRLHVLVVQDS